MRGLGPRPQRIIEYIDGNLDDGKPFLAGVGYHAVHCPHHAPKSFIDKYDGVYDAGFKELRATRLTSQKKMGLASPEIDLDLDMLAPSYKPWQMPDWDVLSDEKKKFNARRVQTYAGMVDNMDVNINKILSYLDEKDLADTAIAMLMAVNVPDPTAPTRLSKRLSMPSGAVHTNWMAPPVCRGGAFHACRRLGRPCHLPSEHKCPFGIELVYAGLTLAVLCRKVAMPNAI